MVLRFGGLVLVCLVAAATGCGGSSGGNGQECACVAGQSLSCSCSNGDTGAQTCSDDCMRLDPCVCDPGMATQDMARPRDMVEPLPKTVTVTAIGAYVGPGMADGSQWDGVGTVPPETITALGQALGASNPIIALATFFADPAVDLLAKPDPIASGEVYAYGKWQAGLELANITNNTEDTFTPLWPQSPSWTGVPFDSKTRVRFTVLDEDFSANDPIGTAEINYSDLLTAYQLGKVHHVRVADQTQNQLLFVSISVVAE